MNEINTIGLRRIFVDCGKKMVLRSHVQPFILCGSEYWTTINKLVRNYMEIAEMCFYRKMCTMGR